MNIKHNVMAEKTGRLEKNLRKVYIDCIEKHRAKKQGKYKVYKLIDFIKKNEFRKKEIPDSIYSVEYENWEYALDCLIRTYIKKNDLELVQMNNRYGFNNVLTSSFVYLQRYGFGSDCLPFLESISIINPKWSIAFDVGANVGLVSCFLAKYCTFVHSFEPSKSAIMNFEKNLKINDFENIILNKIAVGNCDGVVQLFDCGLDNSGHNSIIKHEQDSIMEQYEVPITTIKTYCEQHNISNIDFMKIDVEGAELDVFDGMQDLIKNKQIEIICFEISGEIVDDWEQEKKIIKMLTEAGYILYDTKFRLVNIDELMYKRIHRDIFAIVQEKVGYYIEKFSDKTVV